MCHVVRFLFTTDSERSNDATLELLATNLLSNTVKRVFTDQ